MKLQEIKNRFSITVPKSFVQLLGWKKGQELIIYTDGERKLAIKEMPAK